MGITLPELATTLARKYGTTVEQIEKWVKDGQLKGDFYPHGLSIPASELPVFFHLLDGDPDPRGSVAKVHEGFREHFELQRESEEAMNAKRYPPKKGGELEKVLQAHRLPAPKRGERERPMSEKEGQ